MANGNEGSFPSTYATEMTPNMTEFEPSIFPYFFECSDCTSTAEIGHEETTEAVPPGIEATPRQAVNRALNLRGWWRKDGRLLCSECSE